MLQQTQVSRVLMKYDQFLRRFPTLRALAQAPQRMVVIEWRGMGYNNRAVRLHQLARQVVEKYDGRVPNNADLLLALPGVGKYTANAVLSSAFNQRVPIVEVNVRRFLSRCFCKMNTVADVYDEDEIWKLAGDLLPRSGVYSWNQALMDIGAMICTARQPRCGECPVAARCASSRAMSRNVRPKGRQEQSLAGIPNRIHRGRIVEILRNSPARLTRGVPATTLGRKLLGRFSPSHGRWLTSLLVSLERDGLIRISGNGTLRSRRIQLA
jgi:A/G-specific adenine glycosylase